MRRIVLLLATAPLCWGAACRADAVYWTSTYFVADGYYNPAHVSDPIYFDGPATVAIGYDTDEITDGTGMTNVTISVLVDQDGQQVGGFGQDPYGNIIWDGTDLSLSVDFGPTTMVAEIPGPGITAPPGTIPNDLSGLDPLGASVYGYSLFPDTWSLQATGIDPPASASVPEPPSGAVTTLGLLVVLGLATKK